MKKLKFEINVQNCTKFSVSYHLKEFMSDEIWCKILFQHGHNLQEIPQNSKIRVQNCIKIPY